MGRKNYVCGGLDLVSAPSSLIINNSGRHIALFILQIIKLHALRKASLDRAFSFDRLNDFSIRILLDLNFFNNIRANTSR